MVLRYPDNWRMQNIGLEGAVLLERESQIGGSFPIEKDIVYYIHDGTFRENTLVFDNKGMVVDTQDRKMLLHPFLDKLLRVYKTNLYCYVAFGCLAYLVSPETTEEYLSSPDFLMGTLLGFVLSAPFIMRATSSTAIDAWKLYRDIEEVEL